MLYIQEIEIIESTWKDETRGLLETVSTLEDDNKKLTAVLTENLIVIWFVLGEYFCIVKFVTHHCFLCIHQIIFNSSNGQIYRISTLRLSRSFGSGSDQTLDLRKFLFTAFC